MHSLKRLTTSDISPEFITNANSAFPDTENWVEDSLKTFVENDSNILLIAEFEGNIAGHLSGYVLQRTDARNKELFIYDVETSPEFQRKGIASELITKALEIGKEAGVKEAFVFTEDDNKAGMSLYQKTGGTMSNEGKDVMFEWKL